MSCQHVEDVCEYCLEKKVLEECAKEKERLENKTLEFEKINESLRQDVEEYQEMKAELENMLHKKNPVKNFTTVVLGSAFIGSSLFLILPDRKSVV